MFVCGCLLFTVFAFPQDQKSGKVQVSDSASAFQIAEKALIRVYGKKQIESE